MPSTKKSTATTSARPAPLPVPGPAGREELGATSPAAPAPAGDEWQKAHDALQVAFEQGNAALAHTADKAQRKTLNKLLDTLSDQLTALNQEDLKSHTISLQAASHQLSEGIESLRSLRDELQGIAATIAGLVKVVGAVDGVLSGLSALLATFPVV